jgi:hypothetical protein
MTVMPFEFSENSWIRSSFSLLEKLMKKSFRIKSFGCFARHLASINRFTKEVEKPLPPLSI